MSQYTSYWLYQKYEKRGDQDWIPAYPNVYSVDGDGTMNLVVKQDDDPACGYTPTGETIYRWNTLNPNVDYYCEECPISPVVEIYRWGKAPVTDYVCSGTTKYYKEYYQFSVDGGVSWQNVIPIQSRTSSDVIEYNSVDCGYIPTGETIYRWVKTDETSCVYVPNPTEIKYYGICKNDITYSVDCNDNPNLSTGETRDFIRYHESDLIEAIIGDCVTSIGSLEDIPSVDGNGNFNWCTSLTAVTIPSGVTHIGQFVFGRCKSLPSIKLPSELTSLGRDVFRNCNSFTSVGGVDSDSSVELPSGLTSISRRAFEECTGLTKVVIPGTVKSIEVGAFRECSGITSVTIENGVERIGGGAFSYCDSITSVYIPSSVNYIQHYDDISVQEGCESFNEDETCYGLSVTSPGIFGDCRNLTSIVVDASNTVYDSRNNCNGIIETSTNTLIGGCKNTVIPNSVVSIYKEAFKLCTSLTSIVIPDSVITIEPSAFYGCISLTSCTIGSGVTYIQDYTFDSCKKLQNINIPDNVTGIGDRAFACCTSLTGVTIGSGANISIYDEPFANCINLESIVVDNNNPYISSMNNCNAIIKGNNEYGVTLMVGCKNTVIPNGVETIRSDAFNGCTGLTEINIPNSVKAIQGHAFSNCTSLSSVTIGSSVTNIGFEAFTDCTGLTIVRINATTPPTLGQWAFSQTNLNAILVPRGSANLYKIYPGWTEYSSIIRSL